MSKQPPPDELSEAERGSTPSWSALAEQVAVALGVRTLRSPTLRTVIERGVRYVRGGEGDRALVFDRRALFLGFVAAGQEDPDSIHYGNTASWFVHWLGRRVGRANLGSALARARMADTDQVFRALSSGRKVTLSPSVYGLLRPAEALAASTIDRPAFEARHVFSVMILSGALTAQVQDLLGVKLTPRDLDELKRELAERILENPEPQETRERWFRALELVHSLPDEEGHGAPVDEPDGVSPFRNDAPGGADVLGTERDVRALARLMCLKSSAPLAVAIFGEWGSGKSTFMDRLDWEVEAITAEASRSPSSPVTPETEFVRRVVQVRFNAWHFVDANLWASLTAEFFDQLRAGGHALARKASHAELVARVNSHVHALSTETEKTRRSVDESGKTLRDAQSRRDEAAVAVRSAGRHALGEASLTVLGELYASQRANLSALGLAVSGVDTAKAVDAIVDAAKSSDTIVGRCTVIARVLAKSRWRLWTTVIMTVIFLGGVAALWARRDDAFTLAIGMVSAVGGFGMACLAAAPAIRIVAEATRRAADIAGRVDQAEGDALKALLGAEAGLQDAAREAEARQSAARTAEQRLARYVDPKAAANPPRLLRYVLEDDPDTRALQADLGLLARARRLFEAVDQIVREERGKPHGSQLDGEVPDRVVIYIDDLDRCTEAQVYNVLQAIHLLLAFELFVVVVGVDAGRVESALAHALKEPASAGGHPVAEGGGGETPNQRLRQEAARYLQKIFQVAFWLEGLHSGADGGSFGRYVQSLTEFDTAVDHSGAPTASSPSPAPPESVADSGPDMPTSPPPEEFKPLDEGSPALAAIRLSPAEAEFLGSPIIGALAATTPRAVKRLVNTYRLVRARLADSGVSVLGAGGAPPAYPLIALLVAVETGQSVAVADDLYEGLMELSPGEAIMQAALTDIRSGDLKSEAKPHRVTQAVAGCPALRPALEAAYRLRGASLVAGDMQEVARVARRYSFNRYA